jgi:hypothetical protein
MMKLALKQRARLNNPLTSDWLMRRVFHDAVSAAEVGDLNIIKIVMDYVN